MSPLLTYATPFVSGVASRGHLLPPCSCSSLKWNATPKVRMIRWSRPLFYASLNDQSRPLALAGGTLLLTSTLANRLFITSLEQFDTAQSQADILTVVGAATLVLYGLGRVSVQESKESVDVGGVDVHVGFETDIKISKFETGNDNVTVANPKPSLLQRARNEAQWISKTLFASIPSITSFAVLLDGTELCRAGRFRSKDAVSSAPPNGIAANSLETGKRAYLADMKVVPVKEVEFGFLPEKCQSVIVQPFDKRGVIIIGANRPRPFTQTDFGWLQALTDRFSNIINEEM